MVQLRDRYNGASSLKSYSHLALEHRSESMHPARSHGDLRSGSGWSVDFLESWYVSLHGEEPGSRKDEMHGDP